MYGTFSKVQTNVRHCSVACSYKTKESKSGREWLIPYVEYVAHYCRKCAFMRFLNPTNGRQSTPTPLGQDIVSYFWSTLVTLIPRSLQHGESCQQFFEIALIVFRTIDDSVREKLDFAAYIQIWSDLLLRHKHVEVCRKLLLDNSMLIIFSLLVETPLIGLFMGLRVC